LYINLTQITENLEWSLSRISGQLFWRTLLESKWCLQIPLRTFITCVMTDRGRNNLQVLSCTQSTTYKITTQRKLVFLRCSQIETWKLNTNWRFIFFPHNSDVLSMGRLATISFSILSTLNKYLFTMEIEFRVMSLEARLRAVLVFHKKYIKWCIINATKEKYQFILKI